MTFREAITFNDAVARLKRWKKREQRNQWNNVAYHRRQVEMWRNRALVQSERAQLAEREVRKLRAQIERLTVATTMDVVDTGSPLGADHRERRRRFPISPAPAALLPPPSPSVAAVPTTSSPEPPPHWASDD